MHRSRACLTSFVALTLALQVFLPSSRAHAQAGQETPEPALDTGPLEIAAAPELGFHFNFFLFVPPDVSTVEPVRLLVEPNNSGTTTDDYLEEVRWAWQIAAPGGGAHWLASRLRVPLLVPAFPRRASTPHIYTHALDRDTMLVGDGDLVRLDLQLLAMIDHARVLLESRSVTIERQVFLHGFSGAGSFVNRFATLHPEMVRAVVAGGTCAQPIVPLPEIDGVPLPYPLGVADIERLTGRPFNSDAYREIAQLIYMGAHDRNDNFPYEDAWSDWERAILKEALGREMMPARWARASSVVGERLPRAQFVTYESTGHEVREEMWDDIAEFFRRNTAPGFAPIEPHRYPATEYIELRNATISGAYWAGDPRIAGWHAPEHGGDFMLEVENWMSREKLREHLREAGFRFVLRADGHPPVAITPEHWIASMTSGSTNRGAHLVQLDESTRNSIVPGVEYRIEPVPTDRLKVWTVKDHVVLVRPGGTNP